ncbi:hypothetical protein [Spongiivirga citrea]|uniref:Extracellular endo-alpha-(1->5)-L-arabinanase C-terminal domain-containing protein n=1 Tax=Spongiivirga citrea TaxID=1481457 RepID=A0A6M0CJR9_9FLAO|nr:hypothetical protein [Spongiivirga citrea]NER18188.1 hypothetical protein [Spongiivirga citrea]
MKHVSSKLVILLISFVAIQCATAQKKNINTNELIGTWKLDMSPQDKTDSNFAMMRIDKINKSSFDGVFYREGVPIKEARINTQRGIIYGALVSGDNSGDYNTSFYLKNGVLYGSTHSLKKDFLAVWTATKQSKK